MTTDVEDRLFDAMTPGTSATFDWTVTEAEIDGFAALSGDINPLHVDADHARAEGFEDRVAHGFLLGAKVSALIGTRLPGKRCLLLEQRLAYPDPVYPGNEVTISAEIAERQEDLQLVTLNIRATRMQNGTALTVARGKVTCKILS
jgi:acyl dehydratase